MTASSPYGPESAPLGDPLRVGTRVVVRYRRPPGSHPPLTDVVGVVTAVEPAAVTVEGSRGPVTVRRSDVVVARAVPPRPARRGRPHAAISIPDLERLMTDGWRAVEEEWMGGWLLRASSGFTARANCVLPLGDPGVPRAAAIERVEKWYAFRGLVPRFHLDLPEGGDAVDDPLAADLVARGYRVVAPTVVMTGASSDVEPAGEGAVPVTAVASLEPAWLAAYGQQREAVPGVTEQLLTGSAGQVFLSTTGPGGTVTALARLAVHPGWAGLQAVWVDPAARGRGLARTVVRAAAMLARQRGLPSMYLQVRAGSEVATALYESEGFRPHHRYAYLVPER